MTKYAREVVVDNFVAVMIGDDVLMLDSFAAVMHPNKAYSKHHKKQVLKKALGPETHLVGSQIQIIAQHGGTAEAVLICDLPSLGRG